MGIFSNLFGKNKKDTQKKVSVHHLSNEELFRKQLEDCKKLQKSYDDIINALKGTVLRRKDEILKANREILSKSEKKILDELTMDAFFVRKKDFDTRINWKDKQNNYKQVENLTALTTEQLADNIRRRMVEKNSQYFDIRYVDVSLLDRPAALPTGAKYFDDSEYNSIRYQAALLVPKKYQQLSDKDLLFKAVRENNDMIVVNFSENKTQPIQQQEVNLMEEGWGQDIYQVEGFTHAIPNLGKTYEENGKIEEVIGQQYEKLDVPVDFTEETQEMLSQKNACTQEATYAFERMLHEKLGDKAAILLNSLGKQKLADSQFVYIH